MALRILFLCTIILLIGSSLAKERDHKMTMLLVPIGEVDKRVLDVLKTNLNKVFNRQTLMSQAMPEPEYSFNKKRNQYLSTDMLSAMAERKEYAAYEKVLGIVDHDLYVPQFNFVFGEASRKAAVISLTRLKQDFYNLPPDRSLFHKRVLTEAVHELGHTYGLGHCQNPRCVMFFSNRLMDTDRKGWEFCAECKTKL